MWYFAAFVLGMHFGKLLGNIINRFYTEESHEDLSRLVELENEASALFSASYNYKSMGRLIEAEECSSEAKRISELL